MLILMLALALGLAACGGGGGTSAEEPTGTTLPIPTTVQLGSAGGEVTAPLAGAASMVLLVPEGAVAANTPFTVTPEAAEAGQWGRFSISPDLASLAKPVTVRVKPPANVTSADVPVLQALTPNGALQLPTRLLATGELEVVVQPTIYLRAQALAAAGSASALAAGVPVAKPELQIENPSAGPATRRKALRAQVLKGTATGAPSVLAGVNAAASCVQASPILADVERVIATAPSVHNISDAYGILANLLGRCAPNSGPQAVLDAFAARVPGMYAAALSNWRDQDHSGATANTLARFKQGVMRLAALCEISLMLGTPLSCIDAADVTDQFQEVVDGVAAQVAAADVMAPMTARTIELFLLIEDLNAIGVPEGAALVEPATRAAADHVTARAYALCNHAELLVLRRSVNAGLPSSSTVDGLNQAIAVCALNIRLESLGEADPITGVRASLGEATFAPGNVLGVGRSEDRTELPAVAGGLLRAHVTGVGYRCSRIIGSASANDVLSLRFADTSSTALARQDPNTLNGSYEVPVASVISDLGRPGNSSDPIDLDVMRQAINLAGCTDSGGNDFRLELAARAAYKARLVLPAGATVWDGTVKLTVQDDLALVHELGFNIPYLQQGGQQVSYTATYRINGLSLQPGRPTFINANHTTGRADGSFSKHFTEVTQGASSATNASGGVCRVTTTINRRWDYTANNDPAAEFPVQLTLQADGQFELRRVPGSLFSTLLFSSTFTRTVDVTEPDDPTCAPLEHSSQVFPKVNVSTPIAPAHVPVLTSAVAGSALTATGSITTPASGVDFRERNDGTTAYSGNRVVRVELNLVRRP